MIGTFWTLIEERYLRLYGHVVLMTDEQIKNMKNLILEVKGREEEEGKLKNVWYMWWNKANGKKVSGRGCNGQGPMESEDRYEVKGNHCTVKDSLINYYYYYYYYYPYFQKQYWF